MQPNLLLSLGRDMLRTRQDANTGRTHGKRGASSFKVKVETL